MRRRPFFMADLVTARGERVTLDSARSYTLGRGADCDLVLSDPLCSRHHARITIGGERTRGLLVEDLGSRNGTFVNELPISGPTSAKEGCTIRIGATVYTLCASTDEDDQHHEDTGTVAIERLSLGMEIDNEMLSLLRRGGGSRTDFAGKLDSVDLTDLLQMLIQHGRSGTLQLALRTGEGNVEVRHGEVVSAQFEESIGFEALVEMAREGGGSFRLEVSTRPCPRNITHSAQSLLFELCRALDERRV